MKALVYHGDHHISLEEKEVPIIQKPTDIIIKMMMTRLL